MFCAGPDEAIEAVQSSLLRGSLPLRIAAQFSGPFLFQPPLSFSSNASHFALPVRLALKRKFTLAIRLALTRKLALANTVFFAPQFFFILGDALLQFRTCSAHSICRFGCFGYPCGSARGDRILPPSGYAGALRRLRSGRHDRCHTAASQQPSCKKDNTSHDGHLIVRSLVGTYIFFNRPYMLDEYADACGRACQCKRKLCLLRKFY